jgi:hypothetical protein
LIQLNIVAFSGGAEAQGVVDAIRSTFDDPSMPAGLGAHLTGQLATQLDTIKASGSSQDQTQSFSLLFIVVLLLLAFRACWRRSLPDPGGLRPSFRAGDRGIHSRHPCPVDHRALLIVLTPEPAPTTAYSSSSASARSFDAA